MDENLFLNKQLCDDYNSKFAHHSENFDHSENDATHPLLRADRYPTTFVYCLSCKRQIQSNSLSDICVHYMVHPHPISYIKCLYCSGYVHHYLRSEKLCPEVYHYCSPRKHFIKK